MNRNSSDRLTQAESLWRLLRPRGHPVAAFEEAWRQVSLIPNTPGAPWAA